MSINLAGIYVETPYQLFNAINIAKNYLNVDGCFLFLMEDYYRTDRKFRIGEVKDDYIKGIYYIQDYTEIGTLRHHMLRFKGFLKGYGLSNDYVNMCCYYRTKPKKLPDFSAIICNKYDVHFASMYKKIYKKNPTVFIIEDGIGDYVMQPKAFGSEIKRMFYWSDLFNKNFTVNSLQAPIISKDNTSFAQIINSLFDFDSNSLPGKCKCVYFHQPIVSSNEIEKEKIEEQEEVLVKKLLIKYGDGFYIKLHPRDDLSLFPQYQKIKSEMPWEAMIINKNDVSDMILVGLHSTTLVSPKLTFDFEPYVISLEKMWRYWTIGSKKENVNRIDELFTDFKRLYRKTDKVIVPENEKELFDYIDRIKEND